MALAARQGDPTTHGGIISQGYPQVTIEGQPAARVGDLHTCPMMNPTTPPTPHVGGPITGPGAPTVLIGGQPAARMGDWAVCAGPIDVIIMGAKRTEIGGPAPPPPPPPKKQPQGE